MSLIAFFDILGTKEKTMSGRFSALDAREFVAPIGLAAGFTPKVRFAVFSDSLILTAEAEEIPSLLRAVNFIYGNWLEELIYVRGGISCGEVHWVDDEATDKRFQRLRNLTYSRIYGKGLVAAYQLEQRSGPGAVCYLTDGAATLFREIESASVLDGHAPMLCWATEPQAQGMFRYAASHLDRSDKDSPEWGHAYATKHYWRSVIAQAKFLPDAYRLKGDIPTSCA